MSEREGETEDNQELVLFQGIEQSITPKGTETYGRVYGIEEDEIEETQERFEDLFGGKMTIFKQGDPRTNSFFFSSKKWNSNWNPEGPKKNYGPPKDPSQN
jgi:hypothetical protein